MIGLFVNTSLVLFCIILEYSYNENPVFASLSVAIVRNVFRAGSCIGRQPNHSLACTLMNRVAVGPLRMVYLS